MAAATVQAGSIHSMTGQRVRKWRMRVVVFAAGLLVVFAASTARVLIWPVQGAPAHVDAIVMLAGAGDRLPAALALAKEGRAPVLVISLGTPGSSGPCPPPTPGVRTICFNPSPGNTRGEAEYASALARRSGWHSLLLVTSRPQAARAQLLFGRCFSGQVYVSTAPLSAGNWPYQIAYGWGALTKAVFLTRSC
jgi:uncharacterized SAM-binding protein YcdF (DUF218 family)